MTRHCAKALANIGGKKSGSNAPLGENTSEDMSVAAGARGAQSNAPIATADAPAARRLQITQPDEFPTSRPARRTINNMNPETFEDGYDSEGDLPFAPDYDSDSDDDGYEGLGVVCVDEPLSEEEGGEGDEEEKKGKQHPKLTKEQVEKIAEEGGVVLLMEYLAERGLPIYGSKAEKMKRLLEGKKKKKKAAKQPKKTDNPLAGLPPGAEWVLLNPAPEPVPEPENVDLTLRPPSELEAKKVNPRYEYSETFDRVPFTGTNEFLPHPPEKKQSLEGRKKKVRGLT